MLVDVRISVKESSGGATAPRLLLLLPPCMVPRAWERAAICSAVNVGVFPVETGGAEVEAEVGTDAGTVDLRVYGVQY